MTRLSMLALIGFVVLAPIGCEKDNQTVLLQQEIDRLTKQLNECRDSKQEILNELQKTKAALAARTEETISLEAEKGVLEVRETGVLFSTAAATLAILLVNNLLWCVVYWRKK